MRNNSWKNHLYQKLGMVLLICSLLTFYFLWKQDQTASFSNLSIGHKAPDFSIMKADGSAFHLQEQQGHPVLIEFGATWCPACLHSLPDLEALEQSKQNKPWKELTILVVELDGEQKQTQLAQKQKNMGISIGLANKNLPSPYFSDTIPFLVLIDSKGVIKNMWQGFPGLSTLHQALSQVN